MKASPLSQKKKGERKNKPLAEGSDTNEKALPGDQQHESSCTKKGEREESTSKSPEKRL